MVTLSIRNSTPNTVYAVIGYPNEGCTPRKGKRGWYAIRPGRTVLVFGGTANNVFSYYVEDDAGHVWAGDDFTDVPDEAFSRCWIEACKPCRRLGFRGIAFFGGSSDRIINLVLSRSQVKSTSRIIHLAWPSLRKLNDRKYPHGIINKTESKAKSKSGNIHRALPAKSKLKPGTNRVI